MFCPLTQVKKAYRFSIQTDEKIDLVLLDIMMIGMDGWDVLETIKQHESHKNIPVIMLTARHYLEDESETQNYAHLFDGYVVKPICGPRPAGQNYQLARR